jgi:hypothetical protein
MFLVRTTTKICSEGVLINFGGIWTLNPSAYFLPLDYPRTSKIHQTVVSGPEFFCLIHFAYSRPSLTPTAALLLASSFRAPSTSTRLSTVAQLLATPPPLSLSLSLSLSLLGSVPLPLTRFGSLADCSAGVAFWGLAREIKGL